jgi:hypothetical protein
MKLTRLDMHYHVGEPQLSLQPPLYFVSNNVGFPNVCIRTNPDG